ncbi:toll/interleukin-1 receptor domain-containing protein [Sphingopyxis granuli]|uniref:toll/interleukin-1 receptor domain-containing protein n=1 Tax=Sphingopyxis granuli TaxID=267128 RepID=UPI001BAE9FA0|nr:toll/interleukin-1 receptor domain-containing protein [Sphingopyxis granuli]QUM73666.1 toll/interleukin-1 receptor domain-containing protein [Sphingopyxis granuli]
MTKPPIRHLRVVEPSARPVIHDAAAFETRAGDRTLFAASDPSLLVFIDFTAIAEAEFLSLLVSSRPKIVIDARAAPRFDVGNLNRKLVFSMFKDVGSSYFDLGAMVGTAALRSIASDADQISSIVQTNVFRGQSQVEGPVAIILEKAAATVDFIDRFAASIDHVSRSGWTTLKVPVVKNHSGLGQRSVVFISHATPNDNPFAQWLATQLSLSGYEVWTDFDRLGGGELFWDTIEDVIRNKAAKVVVAASRLAQTRSGVLDEVSLAITMERTLGLDNFVVPLRIDDMPHSEFRANLLRKNIIDFNENWASGLAALLKTFEEDRVPADAVDSALNVGKLIHERLRTRKAVVEKADPVSINWLHIRRWPPAVHAVSLSTPAHRVGAVARTVSVPHVPYEGMLLSFSPAAHFSAELGGIGVSQSGSVATGEFLSGRWNQHPSLKPHLARRIIANLVRQAWELTAQNRKLSRFDLASGASAWFFADNVLEGNKSAFIDRNGKKRSRALVGFSRKRKVYWHFAAEIRPLANDPTTLVVKPHVIFTEDGINPLESAAKMHALRRGFCKSWWNDRWRDLIAAFLSWLAEDEGELKLGVGSGEISYSASMMALECPVSPDENDDMAEPDDAILDEDDPEIDEEELGYSLALASQGEGE